MILAIDVQYDNVKETAVAAGVGFWDHKAAEPSVAWTVDITSGIGPYVPGQFAMRELGCILSLLSASKESFDIIIVDGNAWNAPEVPGLGAIVWDCFNERVPVIGVAKNKLRGSEPVELLRGKSRKPLFITAAGMPVEEAVTLVREMHGENRTPTLLKKVDHLARGWS